MLNVVLSNRFQKDLKRAAKRGYPIEELKFVVDELTAQNPLAQRFSDHPLTGNYVGFRECHIRPDWLLIYRVHENDLILFLSRTGTHTDLF